MCDDDCVLNEFMPQISRVQNQLRLEWSKEDGKNEGRVNGRCDRIIMEKE